MSKDTERYTTYNELTFLDQIPELYVSRNDLTRGATPGIVKQYHMYLEAMKLRKNWGAIDKKEVMAHCKAKIKQWG